MSTHSSAVQLRSNTATPRRTTNTKKAAIAATASLLVAGVATQATDWFDASPSRTPSRESVTHDLVERGLIPRQTLDPVPPSRESITRDLVERGLIPSQSVEPHPSANFARWSVGVRS